MKIEPTDPSTLIDPTELLRKTLNASNSSSIEELLKLIPVRNEHEYKYSVEDPSADWHEGMLHWYPVGGDRGNAGRIKQANRPINPIAERTINAMEALIEMMRHRELLANPNAPPPENPREAVRRYFLLPPLDQLPTYDKLISGSDPRKYAREIARKINVALQWDRKLREFSVVVHDFGIGQPPAQMHKTLLSLGAGDKGDKPYLIGVFGQGGSSAYAASQYSTIISRRASDLLKGEVDGIGWTIVKHVFPKGRRDDFFTYLAAHPDGRVPTTHVSVADSLNFQNGSRFAHINYNFGTSGSAVTRNFHQIINHALFNPILPFDTDVSGTVATIYGNGYRLSNIADSRKAIDKTFSDLTVEK
jgi:hypothetical protein